MKRASFGDKLIDLAVHILATLILVWEAFHSDRIWKAWLFGAFATIGVLKTWRRLRRVAKVQLDGAEG
jgi:hypothetical protein